MSANITPNWGAFQAIKSSSGARELFTSRDTGQCCSRSLAAGLNNSRPASLLNQGNDQRTIHFCGTYSPPISIR
jgi:hypothetical protein